MNTLISFLLFALAVCVAVIPENGTKQPELDKCLLRDYQIDLHMDTVWIYDGQRLVGKYTTHWKNQIDSIILKDNL